MARTILKATCETIEHGDGRKDVIINAPVLQLKGVVSEQQWDAIVDRIVAKKYGGMRDKMVKTEQGKADWKEFLDLLLNETHKVRGKTKEDCLNRAIRIAERYGCHLNIVDKLS